MRRVFGILFVIVGIVCLPSVVTPSMPETLGRLLGWALTSVIPAYFLLRNSDKKENVENT